MFFARMAQSHARPISMEKVHVFRRSSKNYLLITATIHQLATHNCSNSTPDFEGYFFINLKGINHEKIS